MSLISALSTGELLENSNSLTLPLGFGTSTYLVLMSPKQEMNRACFMSTYTRSLALCSDFELLCVHCSCKVSMIAAVGSQHCNTPFALFKNSGNQRDGWGKHQNSLRKRIPMEIYLLMRARFCSGSLRNRWFWLLRFITSIHDSQNHTILDQEMSYQLSVVVDRKLARNLEWKWLLGMHLPTIVLYCSTQI